MIDHTFTPRPLADLRLLSMYPRCAFPNCGGAQHEHQEMDADFLAAFYGTDDAGRRTVHATEPEPAWVPVCGKDGRPMSREKGCLECSCYTR